MLLKLVETFVLLYLMFGCAIEMLCLFSPYEALSIRNQIKVIVFWFPGLLSDKIRNWIVEG
jgi:hypothetical protein